MVFTTSVLLLTGFGGLTQRMTCSYTWDISEGLSSYRISWTVPLFISRPDRTSTTRSSYSSSPPPAMLMTSKFNLLWLSCLNFTWCPEGLLPIALKCCVIQYMTCIFFLSIPVCITLTSWFTCPTGIWSSWVPTCCPSWWL